MKKLFGLIFLLAALLNSAFASDNLILTKYMRSSDVPSSFITMGGGSALTGKTYKDDEGDVRTDKVYYTVTQSYKSSYRASDIMKMLNPSEGKLSSLLSDTSVNKVSGSTNYKVNMSIQTPFQDFDCTSVLSYKSYKSGNKTVFKYEFDNFNMVFTGMTIQVEIQEVGSDVKVNVYQIAAMKGSTYSKLKKYFAIGKFESKLKASLMMMKDGIGGI